MSGTLTSTATLSMGTAPEPTMVSPDRTRRIRVAARPAALLRERRLQVAWDPDTGDYRITVG